MHQRCIRTLVVMGWCVVATAVGCGGEEFSTAEEGVDGGVDAARDATQDGGNSDVGMGGTGTEAGFDVGTSGTGGGKGGSAAGGGGSGESGIGGSHVGGGGSGGGGSGGSDGGEIPCVGTGFDLSPDVPSAGQPFVLTMDTAGWDWPCTYLQVSCGNGTPQPLQGVQCDENHCIGTWTLSCSEASASVVFWTHRVDTGNCQCNPGCCQVGCPVVTNGGTLVAQCHFTIQ